MTHLREILGYELGVVIVTVAAFLYAGNRADRQQGVAATIFGLCAFGVGQLGGVILATVLW